MSANKVLVVGHSHTDFIVKGLNSLNEFSVKHLHLRKLNLYSNYYPSNISQETLLECKLLDNIFELTGISGRISSLRKIYNEKKTIKELVREHNLKCIVSFNGNQHAVFGLLEKNPPNDIIMDNDDSLFTNEVDIIPYNLVIDHFRSIASNIKNLLLSCLKYFDSQNIYFVEYPPPPQNNKLILDNLDYFFKNRKRKARPKIANANYRYKLWKLSCKTIIEICEETDIRYCPVPVNLLDKKKYLKPEHFANATHANSNFYSEMFGNIFKESL